MPSASATDYYLATFSHHWEHRSVRQVRASRSVSTTELNASAADEFPIATGV